jgi:multidrug efflux pump subunit AcrA (membrane-fusion protein)
MRFLSKVYLISVLFAPASCSPNKTAEQSAGNVMPIKTEKVRHVQKNESVSAGGTVISPDAPVSVSFLVSVKVIHVGPREGEHMEKGQLLAAIDPVDYALLLQTASAREKRRSLPLQRPRDACSYTPWSI